jgi:ankyrin repeat protein
MEWKPRTWDGPLQYEDVETGELMMLPTDLALKTDPKFRVYAELYAKNEEAFFRDFAAAFGKLLTLGVDASQPAPRTEAEQASLDLMEAAMHGSLSVVQKLAPKADVHTVEKASGRNALHKAAFWGHEGTVAFLINEAKVNVNAADYNGDTALHDAARFGHQKVADILIAGKADLSLKNRDGDTPHDVAIKYHQVATLVNSLKPK